MKRIITSLGMLAFVAALVAGGTGAFFSDTETSTGNVFTAGAIDLKVDSQAHYNNMVCVDGTWQPELEFNPPAGHYPATGSPCTTTWGQQTPGVDITSEKFFDFADLKPGDNGENTISLHVFNNDARACVIFDNMKNDDNGLTEPESAVDQTGGAGEGELAQELQFFAWGDDGDNIWEDGELPLFASPYYGPASDVLNGKAYDMGTLPASQTKYVGLYWCYGTLTVDAVSETLTCSGASATNLTQTDSLTGDVWFYVEQARNNPDFKCPSPRKPSATVTSNTGWSPVDLDTTNGQAQNLGGGQQQSEWFAKARNNNSGFELAIGIDDAVPAGQNTAEAVWVAGQTKSFTLSYDGAGNATLAVVGETPVTYSVGGVGSLARIGVNVKAPASVTTTVDNLALDIAAPLSDDDVTVTGGTNHLLITGVNLNQVWTLSGTFVFSAVGSPHAAEAIAVQFSID